MPELESLEGALTLAAARRWAMAVLRAAGVDDAGSDVRRLLAAALGWSPAQILARPEFPLLPKQAETFVGFVERRCRREPVSRILGCREFYGRSFTVSAATLDPRPDSETLIEAALQLIDAEGWSRQPLRILDVGTGTGCLLLTLLCELPQATGLGTDLSAAALAVARGNAAALGVQDRVAWRVADLLENVDGPFHMMLSNPPYLRSAEIATLEPEVSRFDPCLALDGGADGLEIFRKLSARVPEVVGDGWIVLEVGHDQADQVAELLRWARPAGGPANVTFYTDVSGKRRCVAVRTRN
jgi:release factor glutamine methyltransferase